MSNGHRGPGTHWLAPFLVMLLVGCGKTGERDARQEPGSTGPAPMAPQSSSESEGTDRSAENGGAPNGPRETRTAPEASPARLKSEEANDQGPSDAPVVESSQAGESGLARVREGGAHVGVIGLGIGFGGVVNESRNPTPAPQSPPAESEVVEELLDLSGHVGPVGCVDFSPDGTLLLSGGVDGTIRIWDSTTGLMNQNLKAPTGYKVQQGFFLGSHLRALTVSQESVEDPGQTPPLTLIQVWDLASGKEVDRSTTMLMGRLALSSDRKAYAVARPRDSGNQRAAMQLDIQVIDLETRTVRATLGNRHSEPLTGRPIDLSWVPNEPTVLVSTADAVFSWNVDSGDFRPLRYRPDLGNVANPACGGRLTVSADHRFLFARAGQLVAERRRNDYVPFGWMNERSNCATFSPDGKIGLLGLERGICLVSLEVLARRRGQPLSRDSKPGSETKPAPFQPAAPINYLRYGHLSPVLDLAFSPDGARFASGHSDGSVIVWDVRAGSELVRCGHLGKWATWEVGCGNTVLRAGFRDHRVELARRDSKESRPMRRHQSGVIAVAVSADCQLGFSAGLDRIICVWDLASGDLLRVLEGHKAGICRLALAKDAPVLLSVGLDGAQHVWDVASGTELSRIRGLAYALEADSRLSPNGQLLLGSDVENNLFLWDVPTGKVVSQRRFGDERLIVYAFSPTGEQILVRTSSKTPYLFDIRGAAITNQDALKFPWVTEAWNQPPTRATFYVQRYRSGGGGSRTIVIPR